MAAVDGKERKVTFTLGGRRCGYAQPKRQPKANPRARKAASNAISVGETRNNLIRREVGDILSGSKRNDHHPRPTAPRLFNPREQRRASGKLKEGTTRNDEIHSTVERQRLGTDVARCSRASKKGWRKSRTGTSGRQLGGKEKGRSIKMGGIGIVWHAR